jgi:hypothetical protein
VTPISGYFPIHPQGQAVREAMGCGSFEVMENLKFDGMDSGIFGSAMEGMCACPGRERITGWMSWWCLWKERCEEWVCGKMLMPGGARSRLHCRRLQQAVAVHGRLATGRTRG